MWFLLAAAAAGGLAWWGFQYNQPTNDGGNPVELPPTTTAPEGPLLNETGGYAMIVPTERGTWPTGDKIWAFCQAIAVAEGYQVPGSNPARLNNPGDISDYAGTYGFEAHSGSNVTHFPDAETGWRMLYAKIRNALTGKSAVYSPQMTFLDFAKKYAGDWQHWYVNVTNDLGVDPGTKIGDWYNA